jgi:23S rRNA pseudouridine1911/1915/1917 synthase
MNMIEDNYNDDIELLDEPEVVDAGDGTLYEHWKIEVDPGQTPVRIDKFLSEKNPYQSRNRIQNAADAGFIHVNGKPVKSNYKVRPNDVITLMLDHPKHDTSIVAEDIPLNIVYEDDALMAVEHLGQVFRLPRSNGIKFLRDLHNFMILLELRS